MFGKWVDEITTNFICASQSCLSTKRGKSLFEAPLPYISPSFSLGELEKDWSFLQGFLKDIKGTVCAPPDGIVTNKLSTGMLLGNGEIGVVAGDTVHSQKFYFGKSDFWGRVYNPGRDNWGIGILSLGGITLSSPKNSLEVSPGTEYSRKFSQEIGTEAEAAAAYRMDQDIMNAEVKTTIQFGKALVDMTSWTADSEDVFVTKLTNCSTEVDVPISLELWMPQSYKDGSGTHDCSELYPYSSGHDGKILWVTRENSTVDSKEYKARAAVAVKLVSADWEDITIGSASVTGSFLLKAGESLQFATVLRSARGLGENCKDMDSLKKKALSVAALLDLPAINKLRADHLSWWKHFWLQSFVNIGDELLEKYYYGAQYVLGCAYRCGTSAPPSIWGNWVTTDIAGWGGRYFLNYNAEAPLYGVFSSNRPELSLPYNDVIFSELPYQQNRTRTAGYKGAAYARTLHPLNLVREAPEVIAAAPEKDPKKLPADQKSNGSFAVLPAVWYYEYTLDREFMKDKLYPHLKELVAFWMDYVTKVELYGGNYRYDVEHSGAHEGPGNDINPCLDIGFIRKLTSVLHQGSLVLEVDPDLRPVWTDFLEHLAPLPTGIYDGMKCFLAADWVDPNQKHDKVMEPGDQPIELEGPVYPGENVALGGNPEDVEIARNTLKYMNSWSISKWNEWNSTFNGFCKVYPIAARVGWPAEDLLEKFKASITKLWRASNLTVFQGGGGIETSGSVEAVNSMLMQSEFGVIKVFPTWPRDRKASFKRLLAKGAFLVSSELSEDKVNFIELTSKKGGTIKVQNPWKGTRSPLVTEVDTEGKFLKAMSFTIDGTSIVFETAATGRYKITEA